MSILDQLNLATTGLILTRREVPVNLMKMTLIGLKLNKMSGLNSMILMLETSILIESEKNVMVVIKQMAMVIQILELVGVFQEIMARVLTC